MILLESKKFAFSIDVADRYEAAKTALIIAKFSGIKHPHYIESYYVLSNHIAQYDFK